MTAYPNRAPLPGYDCDPAASWDGKKGNFGLWYDKYCDRWAPAFDNLYEPTAERKEHGHVVTEACDGGRIEWLRKAIEAAQAHQGDKALLEEFAARQKAFVAARGGICFQAKTVKKFASGLGRAHPVQNGFEWHYSLGVPVLRSSGAKGMVRDWATTWLQVAETETDRILGAQPPRGPSCGSVDFLPALPIEPPKFCIDGTTPHLTKYYQNGQPPADWYSPVPLQWLAVAPSAVFQFALVPARRQSQSDVNTAGKWLIAALETIGAGAATAADRGRFAWISGWHPDRHDANRSQSDSD
jgi:CRISPR-associated protein Cmr6